MGLLGPRVTSVPGRGEGRRGRVGPPSSFLPSFAREWGSPHPCPREEGLGPDEGPPRGLGRDPGSVGSTTLTPKIVFSTFFQSERCLGDTPWGLSSGS